MADQLTIWNMALTLVAEKRLSSLSDDDGNRELLSNFWEMARDARLTSSAWSFAIQRKALAVDTAAPAWGFDYQYSLAGDVVRVLQVSETYAGVDTAFFRDSDNTLFRVEGRKILTDLGAPLYVKWIVNSVDVGLWHAAFAMLLACDLAALVNPRATESEQTQQRIEKMQMQAWALAASTNAIEQPSESVADDTWMAAHAS